MDAFHPDPTATPRAPIPVDEAFKSGLLELSTETHPISTNCKGNNTNNSSYTTRKLELLDLPPELLLTIFAHLPAYTLYTLACLSTRTHHLALPLFLAHKGLGPASGTLVLSHTHAGTSTDLMEIGPSQYPYPVPHPYPYTSTKEPDGGVNADTVAAMDADPETQVLHLLSTALFRPALHGMCCTFDFYKPRSEVLGLVRRVRGVLERLGRVREAHADFMGVGAWMSWSREGFGRGRGGVRVDDRGGTGGNGEVGEGGAGIDADGNVRKGEVRKGGDGKEERVAEATEGEEDEVDWEAEVLGILDAFVQRGCETMTVCLAGSCLVSTPQKLERVLLQAERSSRRASSFPMLLPKCMDSLARRAASWWTPSQPLPAPVPSRNALTTFNLHSSMLFHASFCVWLISTLSASALNTLSLQHVDIHPHAWALILPRISLPHLIDLAIDTCSVYYADLAAFLARHPGIQRLKLGRNLREPVSTPHFSHHRKVKGLGELLPRLMHLAATPALLVHLLSPSTFSQEKPLLALKTVTVIVRVPHRHCFDFAVMSKALAPVAARLVTLKLTLEVTVESSGVEWMVLDSPSASESSPSPYSPSLSPSPTPTLHATSTPTPTPIYTPTPSLEAINLTQQHITRLELHLKPYRLPEDVARLLPVWAALFTSLTEVGIWMPGHDGVFGKGVGSAEGGGGMNFIRALFRWCGEGLEGVGVNGVVRSLDGWVLEEARGGGTVHIKGRMEML